MPIQLSVKTTGSAELVRQGLEDLAKEIPLIGRKRIYEKMLTVRTALRKPGARPSYPIQWDSERQRRAFFASDGFGRGIPSQRTGSEGRWQIVKLAEGYRFEHPSPHAVYLWGNYEGARQSKIHEGRWPVLQPLVEAAIQELPPEIESHISYYARNKGF